MRETQKRGISLSSFKGPKDKIKSTITGIRYLKRMSSEVVVYRIMPNFLMNIMQKYFRLEIEGLENIPKNGGAIIAPNHSGFAGFDAMILTHEIFKGKHRIPRVLTHYLWFITKATSIPANKMGYIEATTENGLKELQKGHLIILFPEGENGNFKPTSKAYTLQEFKRGFVRMALNTNTPIIPTIVIGAEETNINLKQLKLGKYLPGLTLPLPMNVIPLPVKWKIKFLPPIFLDEAPGTVNDRARVKEIADEIQSTLQQAINTELQNRPGIFIERPQWLDTIIKELTKVVRDKSK
ncbi:MAG: acyltransferase family protein [Bdellovibrionales bacterium]|nr:acyltransferase family protein [Bdellovibrionales bacterium]